MEPMGPCLASAFTGFEEALSGKAAAPDARGIGLHNRESEGRRRRCIRRIAAQSVHLNRRLGGHRVRGCGDPLVGVNRGCVSEDAIEQHQHGAI